MTQPGDLVRQARRDSVFRWAILGAMALVTIGWLVRGAIREPSVPDNYTNGFSASPGGHAALAELLRAHGRTVRVSAESLKLPAWDGYGSDTLVLLEPRPEYVDEFQREVEALFREALSRPCNLVFAVPKRRYKYLRTEDGKDIVAESEYWRGDIEAVMSAARLSGILAVERRGSGALLVAPGRESETGFANPAPIQTFRWERPPESALPDLRADTLLQTAEGQPVAIRLRRQGQQSGGIVLLADPDVVSNRYLGEPGAGSLAMELFSGLPQGGKLLFEQTLHGFAADADLEYLALTPPGLWLTLSLLLLLGLFGWREATVLRPVAAASLDRRARLYAVDGIARMMLRARDHHAAYRALMRRSALVLGGEGAVVRAGGTRAGPGALNRQTGRIRHAPGMDDVQRLVNAAATLAGRMRREIETNRNGGQA
ncbi:MAG: DUF4350 domain-containing protein [Planctomycetes bacterium]|nr:DUF4350 domain-containing protein [Planctomycetota bacterium]MCL4729315.1 hypothetical protein [Planctomycetota bacterium]